MGRKDGSVIGSEQLVSAGPRREQLNFVLISEGFLDTELPAFRTQAQQFVNTLFAAVPFNGLRCAFNVFRIDVSSAESGADNPATCGGAPVEPAVSARTFFDASFCDQDVRRLIRCDTGLVVDIADDFVPEWHCILLLVNTTKWGGSGGTVAATSISSGWPAIAIHEMGHSLFGLADEYEFWRGCGIDTDRDSPPWTNLFEPGEPNITKETRRNSIKWRDLIDAATPIPTTKNPDCTQCDTQASPVALGTVGLFEGAGYYHCGIYRPEFSCAMRNGGTRFCAVCSRVIRRKLYPYHLNAVSPFERRFRRIHDQAGRSGFVSGFPNFHEADYGNGLVYGALVLAASAADWADVPATTLNNPATVESRFTAVNDYASAQGYTGAFPNFHEADYGYGPVHGTILIKRSAADWRDVFLSDLGNPRDRAQRFRAVHDYAVANGYEGGFPTFHEAYYGPLHGTILIRHGVADWQDVPARLLGNIRAIGERMTSANDYAVSRGYLGAFPNFHEQNYGQGIVYGIILLKQGCGEWRDVPAAVLGNPQTPEARMRAVNDYAVAHGFVSGFPNFHEADYGQGLVYGCILLNTAAAQWADVFRHDLGNPSTFADRFRASNDYASNSGYFSGYPNFHESDKGPLGGVVLLKKGAGAFWRDVPIADFI